MCFTSVYESECDSVLLNLIVVSCTWVRFIFVFSLVFSSLNLIVVDCACFFSFLSFFFLFHYLISLCFFCVRVVFIFVCTLIFSHLISLWLIVPELSRSNILKASSISSSVTFKQSVTLNMVDSVYTKKSLQKEPSQLSSHNSHFSEQEQSTWMFCHFDYFCKNNLWLEKITKIQSNQYLNWNQSLLQEQCCWMPFYLTFWEPAQFLDGWPGKKATRPESKCLFLTRGENGNRISPLIFYTNFCTIVVKYEWLRQKMELKNWILDRTLVFESS